MRYISSLVIKNFLSIWHTLKEAVTSSWVLIRIMIPVSIAVKLLQEIYIGGYNIIEIIGNVLAPVTKLVGLPGEMGLVWATSMITNLYGGMTAFINVAPSLNMTVAQITVITTMMLVAHTFPIELQIARKVGVKLWVMFVFRFVFAFVFGLILNQFFSLTNLLQQTNIHSTFSISQNGNVVVNYIISAITSFGMFAHKYDSIITWSVNQIYSYIVIIFLVFLLMFFIKILKHFGIIDLMTRLLKPLLNKIGIGEEVTTLTIIGLTLGVVYGAALIINESKTNKFSGRNIFYSIALMGLCHSIFEDTFLMLSLGGNFWGIFVGRIILSLVFIFIIVRLCNKIPQQKFEKIFLVKTKTE